MSPGLLAAGFAVAGFLAGAIWGMRVAGAHADKTIKAIIARQNEPPAEPEEVDMGAKRFPHVYEIGGPEDKPPRLTYPFVTPKRKQPWS